MKNPGRTLLQVFMAVLVYATCQLAAQDTVYQISYGSYFPVTPGDLVGFSGNEYSDNLVPLAIFDDKASGRNDVKCAIKGAVGTDKSKAVLVWNKQVHLLKSSVFRSGASTSDVLGKQKICPFTSYFRVKTKDANKNSGPFSLKSSALLVPPSIQGLYDLDGTTLVSYSAPGSKLIVKGNFIGSRNPKVWFEYIKDNKLRGQACRVMEEGKIFTDYFGKNSVMDCNVSSQTYGNCQFVIQLPSKWPSGWDKTDLHDMVIDNGICRAVIPFGTAEPTPPGGYPIPESFSYTLAQSVTGAPAIVTEGGEPLAGIRAEIYDEDPQLGGKMISAFMTDGNGQIPLDLSVSSNLSRIFIRLDYVGLSNNLWMDLATDNLTPAPLVTSGEPIFVKGIASVPQLFGNAEGIVITNKYSFLDTYDSQGVPKSLVKPGDTVSAALLADINASVPEYRPVPLYHPDYLNPGLELNSVLLGEADVWITFVHEGAGYKNLLGFYTYNRNSPPASVNDISAFKIIFPNVSYYGSGGGLYSGDKVYIGRFPADTVIGYFLIPNGWYANKNSYSQYTAYYSNMAFNPETDPLLKQHVILLWDAGRQISLLSFEDMNRQDPSCDHDFNDAVFYVTANPPSALENTNVASIDTPHDRDGDGVSDLFDDYPDDPKRAFKNYYPAKGAYATITYEDMWPELGDYDFNDLVLRYSFTYATNTKAQMVDVTVDFQISAVGANKSNGFAFSMPFAPSIVAAITGQHLNHVYVKLNPNGTEAGQSKAVVVVSDNIFDLISRPGGYYINTQKDAPYVEPVNMQLTISLQTPQNVSSAGPAFFNHFLIVGQTRGHEVHAPGMPPTDLVDISLFGTADDDSKPSSGRYYVSKLNLPWALNIPNEWGYPYEQDVITNSYNRFSEWSRSGGLSYTDWYTLPISAHIYIKPAP